MKAWLSSLQTRERWIVVGGAVAAVVIVLWGAVLRPLGGMTENLRTSVATKQRLLVDVARVEGLRPGLSTENLQGRDQTLLDVVDITAQAHGLGHPRTRANGPSGIDVILQDASFDSLVAWLVTLRGTYGVDVETAQFLTARETGRVNGQVTLRRF
jgi:type II secretory pathway component PulM